MSDIQSLIKMLQSDSHNKRYDACEQLRVSRQSLPQDAIDALIIATNDVNPDVADAAQRALALHPMAGEEKGEVIINAPKEVERYIPQKIIAALFISFGVSVLVSYVYGKLFLSLVDLGPDAGFFVCLLFPITAIISFTVSIIKLWNRDFS